MMFDSSNFKEIYRWNCFVKYVLQLEKLNIVSKKDTQINRINKNGNHIIDWIGRKEYNVNVERGIDLSGGRNYGRYEYDHSG